MVSGTIGVTKAASRYAPVAGGRFQLIDLIGGQSRNGTLDEEFIRMLKRHS